MDKEELKKKILKKSEEIKKLHTDLNRLSEDHPVCIKKRKAIDDCFKQLNQLCKEYKQPACKKPRLFCCF